MSTKNIIRFSDLENVRRKFYDKNIVLGTGCFDLLHVGHVYFLEESRKQGDILIVGINSDNSVSKMKGNSRPIVNQNERAVILASFRCIDFVFIYDDTVADESIMKLRPNVYAVGEQSVDAFPSEIIAAKKVNSTVYSIKRIPSSSTTSIVTSIMESTDNQIGGV